MVILYRLTRRTLSTLAEIIEERMILEICWNVPSFVTVSTMRVKKEEMYLKNMVFRTMELFISSSELWFSKLTVHDIKNP